MIFSEEEERKNEELTRKLLEEERQKREDELKKKRYICTICYSNDKKDTDLYILDECNHRFCRDVCDFEKRYTLSHTITHYHTFSILALQNGVLKFSKSSVIEFRIV